MSASNASFMLMDLSVVRDSNYFNDTINIERVFTHADIAMPAARTNLASDATGATDDVTTEVASEITELDHIQKRELERLAESSSNGAVKSDRRSLEVVGN